ncbi:MAG: AtpZ/AtpI family protein [Alphaproteobacteria bacterium]|nr:AtpZ/AtpI family protein [Alphaproteobacteria bacterium]
MDEEMEEKVSAFEKRVMEARKDIEEIEAHREEPQGDLVGAQAGSEFLALVISGGLLGFGIDYFFHTTPWGIIFMLVMGFVAAVYRANDTTKKNQ